MGLLYLTKSRFMQVERTHNLPFYSLIQPFIAGSVFSLPARFHVLRRIASYKIIVIFNAFNLLLFFWFSSNLESLIHWSSSSIRLSALIDVYSLEHLISFATHVLVLSLIDWSSLINKNCGIVVRHMQLFIKRLSNILPHPWRDLRSSKWWRQLVCITRQRRTAWFTSKMLSAINWLINSDLFSCEIN